MDNYNRFVFIDLSFSPWSHYSRVTEIRYDSDNSFANFAISFSLYNMQYNNGGDDMYHHTIMFSANNPLFVPSSFDVMVPWTTEKLLDFIQHEGTTWTFGESARSEVYTFEGVEPGDGPVWTLYDEVDYYGQASLTAISTVPIPAAVWLLGSGLIGLVGFRRKS